MISPVDLYRICLYEIVQHFIEPRSSDITQSISSNCNITDQDR